MSKNLRTLVVRTNLSPETRRAKNVKRASVTTKFSSDASLKQGARLPAEVLPFYQPGAFHRLFDDDCKQGLSVALPRFTRPTKQGCAPLLPQAKKRGSCPGRSAVLLLIRPRLACFRPKIRSAMAAAEVDKLVDAANSDAPARLPRTVLATLPATAPGFDSLFSAGRGGGRDPITYHRRRFGSRPSAIPFTPSRLQRAIS
jgi:hypothetical protein